ncbi:MAG: endolytic transglycosylase MltG [Eubacteriales bacterium]|nr:endolytic transglycosylase MltG [Eubacteriales bacterium]
MDKNELENTQGGINPVDTAGSSQDVYFTNVEPQVQRLHTESSTPSASATKKRVPSKKKNQGIKETYIFFIVVIIVSMVLSIYAVLCLNDVLAITKNNSTVTVNVEENIDNIDDAVDLLSDNGLIKCKNFCKLFAKFRESQVGPQYRNGYYNEEFTYEAGVYYLTGKMGLEGMLQTLQGDSATAETVTLTFPEGYTVPDIVDKLSENEVCDKAALLSVIQSTEFSYSLVSNLTSKEEVPYRLEGYLFPDTYDFYIGESASSVVRKFLSNGDTKITEKYRKRAEELGYSMNDIIIIASIIQCEAGTEEQMKTISSVIHNRLSDQANFPLLGVDSTADYITNEVGPSLSSTSAHTADYYMNFYNTTGSATQVGLPPSPICNPGIAAIKAALYPENTDYYYFFHDTKGNMYTAKTYSEFKDKINTYAPYLYY